MQPRPILGIDIGGTKTLFGVVSTPSGELRHVERHATPSPEASGEPFLLEVLARAAELARRHDCSAIGLSLCELVDLDGEIRSGHRIRWAGWPVLSRLRAIAPAIVEADIRAAAFAELRRGAGQGLECFLYVNLGTGISSTLITGGRVYAGARGNALLLGSSAIAPGDPSAIEDRAGAAGLLRRAQRAGSAALSAEEVFLLAEQGEAEAQGAIEDAVRTAAWAVGIAVNLLDPEAVIVGGGLAFASEHRWAQLVAGIRQHVWAESTRALPILRAALGSHSALIGAALLASEQPQGMSSPKLR